MTKKSEARNLYELIRNDYKRIINNYTTLEKDTAKKIRNILNNNESNFEDIENIIDKMKNKEMLSKITPLILMQNDVPNPMMDILYPSKKFRYDLLEKLLEKKLINPNYSFSNNSTLFHILAILSKGDISQLLKLAIKYNYNVNIKDNNGNTIIHLAITSPHQAKNLPELLNTLGERFNYNAENNMGYNVFTYFKKIREMIPTNYLKEAKYKEDSQWCNYLTEIDEPYYERDGCGNNMFYKIIETQIPKTRAFFIPDSELIKTLNTLNNNINKLYLFTSIYNNTTIKYVTNENDRKENLRNIIDSRHEEFIRLKEETLNILKECFPGYENDILTFIIDSKITTTFSIIYHTLLSSHYKEINKDYLILPITTDKLFLAFIELFKLEYSCNKEIITTISKKQKVANHN